MTGNKVNPVLNADGQFHRRSDAVLEAASRQPSRPHDANKAGLVWFLLRWRVENIRYWITVTMWWCQSAGRFWLLEVIEDGSRIYGNIFLGNMCTMTARRHKMYAINKKKKYCLVTDFSVCPRSGPTGSPESCSGLPEGHWGSAGSKGDNLSGWAAAPGGGLPTVRLRLAGDAEPCHPAGEKCEHAVVSFQILIIQVHFISPEITRSPTDDDLSWLSSDYRWWRRSTRRPEANWCTRRRRPNTRQRLAAWSSWKRNLSAPSTSPSKSYIHVFILNLYKV